MTQAGGMSRERRNGAGAADGRGRATLLRCAHGFSYVWLTTRTSPPTPMPFTAGHPRVSVCPSAPLRRAPDAPPSFHNASEAAFCPAFAHLTQELTPAALASGKDVG